MSDSTVCACKFVCWCVCVCVVALGWCGDNGLSEIWHVHRHADGSAICSRIEWRRKRWVREDSPADRSEYLTSAEARMQPKRVPLLGPDEPKRSGCEIR